MNRAGGGGIIALCLVVGWVGGYQHKKFKAKAAETAAVDATYVASLSADLQDIKLLSEHLEPRLKGETDPLQIAILLRNILYSRIRFYDEPNVRVAPFQWHRLADTFRKSVFDPSYGHMCGGRTIVYLSALKAFGLTARKVGMYSDVSDLPDIANSHASVEVLIDGRWIAQDPTFNISLLDKKGKHIGWLDAAELLAQEEPVVHSTDGYPTIEGRTIEAYSELTGVTLGDITNYMNTSPYSRNGVTFPPTHTSNWDGTLYYRNGATFRAFEADATGVYSLLAKSF